jgi:hypothetical protein
MTQNLVRGPLLREICKEIRQPDIRFLFALKRKNSAARTRAQDRMGQVMRDCSFISLPKCVGLIHVPSRGSKIPGSGKW